MEGGGALLVVLALADPVAGGPFRALRAGSRPASPPPTSTRSPVSSRTARLPAGIFLSPLLPRPASGAWDKLYWGSPLRAGLAMQVAAHLGRAPWDVLHQGAPT